MRKYILLCIFIVTSLISVSFANTNKGSESNKKGNTRYNVLLIPVDDLRPLLNCYGESNIISPNIDRLAARGIVFTKAYCQWSVCGASRASLLTGLTPDGSGIRNLSTQLRDVNPDIVTLPEYFKNNGYKTYACGKVYDHRVVDEGHESRSWSIPYNSEYTYPVEYGEFVGGTAYRVTSGTAVEIGPEGVDDDGYTDGQICLDGLAKLDEFALSPEENFFLAVGFKKPHIPFIAPKKYWDLYNRDSIQLEPFQRKALNSPDLAYFHNPEPTGKTDMPDSFTYDDEQLGEDILDPDNQRKLIHGYYACVSYIDAQIGKLLDKLEETGFDDNTIILLFGDHGYHLGDHNQWGKHTLFETALRAPLIISSPSGNTGKYNLPVSFLDAYPTLCELAGLEVPMESIQGRSLASLLKGSDLEEDFVVSQYRSQGHAGYSIRSNQYRLTYWMNGRDDRPSEIEWNEGIVFESELYDYLLDPLETENYAGTMEYASVESDLKSKLINWWAGQNEFFSVGGNNGDTNLTPITVVPYINNKEVYVTRSSDNNTVLIHSEIDIEVVNIIDLQGKFVFSTYNHTTEIPVSRLRNGLYMLQYKLVNGDTGVIKIVR